MPIVDLSHTLENNITVYPGTPEPRFEAISSVERDGFAELSITFTTHTGTHIDAPAHILPDGKSLDQFSLDKFIGKGLVIDCRNQTSISTDFIKQMEEEIRTIDFLLFYTGWQEKWNSASYFNPFPTLTTEAVEWLLCFNIKALGFDTISVDAMNDESLPNHHLLLNKEILIIENMTALDRLLDQSFELYCIPLKIAAADASPVRVFAKL